MDRTMKKNLRKTLLYKSGVEYGDYTINHVNGCSHGCKFPCYAMLMAKRFGRIKSYEEWIQPKIVDNALELLDHEIDRYRTKINFVHLSFMTDPFMMGHPEVSDLTLDIIRKLNKNKIKVTLLTKGLLPETLTNCDKYSNHNEYGISLVSLNENFRKEFEPFSSNYDERISSLYQLYEEGLNTWVSIEPFPTPNIVKQDLLTILNRVSFVNKIVFGRMNYNKLVSQYKGYKQFYNEAVESVSDFCRINNIELHIKEKTLDKPTKTDITKQEQTKELFRNSQYL
jgi:DNA repair photolyase